MTDWLRTIAATAVVVCALSGSTPRAQAPSTGPGSGIWAGVYTDEQAKRGESAGAGCTACHGSGLVRGRAPALVGDEFIGRWNGRTLDALFEKIQKTMPRNSPGTLSAQDTADIMAHVLQLNNVPIGTKELPVDQAALATIAIVRPAATAAPAMADSGIWNGIYTNAQAKRGEGAAQDKKCTVCHGDNMKGDIGPPLVGAEFLASWNERSLGELFDLIQKTMPDNQPGILSRQEIADLIAHLLELNNVPAGDKEVPIDTTVLSHIKISTAK